MTKIEELKEMERQSEYMTNAYHKAFSELVDDLDTLSKEEYDELFNDGNSHEAWLLYEEGLKYKQEGNKKKAFEAFKASVEIYGFSGCRTELGLCYYYGFGTKVAYRNAFNQFKECVGIDNTSISQYMIGLCYYEGHGVKEDKTKGIFYLETAGRKGVKEAITYLLEIFKDDKEVVAYWKEKLAKA